MALLSIIEPIPLARFYGLSENTLKCFGFVVSNNMPPGKFVKISERYDTICAQREIWHGAIEF